jgi:hypothetical protein
VIAVIDGYYTLAVAECQTASGPKGADSPRNEATAHATFADAARRDASSTMGKSAAVCVGKETMNALSKKSIQGEWSLVCKKSFLLHH